MIYLNNLQKVCWKHIILLSFIQVLFVFFAHSATAKTNPSAAGVGDGGCTTLVISACVSGELTCATPTAVLKATSSAPNAIYSWSGPNAFASAVQSLVVYLPGIYTVTVTDPNGCSASATVTVVQNTVEPANVTAYASRINNNVVLKGASSTQNVCYGWSGPDGFFSIDQETIVMIPGTYILTVTNYVNGCSISKSVLVVQD